MKDEKNQAAQDLATDAGKWVLDALLGAIPAALLYSLILFAVSVVVILVCQRYKIYTREPKAWNVLTKAHYPVLVLTFMAFGFGLGLISSLQNSSNEVLDEHLHPALTGMVPPVKEKILENLPPELSEKPMTGEEIYNYVVEQISAKREVDEEEKGGVVAQISREVEAEVRAYLVKMLIDQAIIKAGEKAGLSEEQTKFSVETFKAIDFSKQSDEIADKVTGSAKTQVSGFANGLRLQLILYATIILVLMAIDPLIYYLAWLPRRKKAESEEPAAVI